MEGNIHHKHEENLEQVKQISLNDKPTSKLERSDDYESPENNLSETRMASASEDNKHMHRAGESLPSNRHETDDKGHYDNEIVHISLKVKNGDSINTQDGSLSSEDKGHLDNPHSPLYVDIPLKDTTTANGDPLTKSVEESQNARSAADVGGQEADSEDSKGAAQTSSERKGSASILTKEDIFKHASHNQYTSTSVASKLPGPFLFGPHIPFPSLPHAGNPQRPVFMLPHVPQPFLMLPHQMAPAPWPFLPIAGSPQKISETSFVPFSALNLTAAESQVDGAIQDQNISDRHKVKKKQLKKKIKQKRKADTQIYAEEESEGVRYKTKTEYRKTNRASTMLICDKVKLPHKKPRKIPNLVDVSDGLNAESSKSDRIQPIIEYVARNEVPGNVPLNLEIKPATEVKPTTVVKTTKEVKAVKEVKLAEEVKPAKPKKKKVISPKSKGIKKGKGKKKVARGRKPKLGSGVKPVKKVDGRKLKSVEELVKGKDLQKLKQVASQQPLTADVILQALAPKPKPKKKKQLTPEKILYNKLTEVVKKIAEPNVFSPMTLPAGLEIKCSNCNVTYPDRKSLWDHIQCHLRKPVPFRLSKYYRFCRVCQKYVSEIRDHIRACHFDGGTPYECPTCHERFRYKGLLRNHAQNRHTTARNYMCEMCGLAFKQSVTLRKHMLVHTDEKNFFCATCGKAFKTMYALQKHTVVHALVKPYKCEVCNKEFTQQTNMKSHMRTHTGEKPYKCDLCHMAFTHNVSLKTHKKKHHGIDMWNPKNFQPKFLPSSQPASQPIIQPYEPIKQLSNQSSNMIEENQDEIDNMESHKEKDPGIDMWTPKNSQPIGQPTSQPPSQPIIQPHEPSKQLSNQSSNMDEEDQHEIDSMDSHKEKDHGIDMWNPKNSQPFGQPTTQPASQPIIQPHEPSKQLSSQSSDMVEENCDEIDNVELQ